jgi:hypothetical protein
MKLQEGLRAAHVIHLTLYVIRSHDA